MLPQLPLYAKSYHANGLELGLLMASFSAMQFIFAPWWGHWSDRMGRRPVLLISIAGSVVAYAWFAAATQFTGATALWLIIGSRVFAGICGANITVAQAYIADITPPENRSKRMGLIGMAFGLANALLRARIPWLPLHLDDVPRDAAGFSLLILPPLNR